MKRYVYFFLTVALIFMSFVFTVDAQTVVTNELLITEWSPNGQYIVGSGYIIYSDNAVRDYLYLWNANTGNFIIDLNTIPSPIMRQLDLNNEFGSSLNERAVGESGQLN